MDPTYYRFGPEGSWKREKLGEFAGFGSP